MHRAIDLRCNACETERYNVVCAEDETVPCPTCGLAFEQCWWGLTRTSAPAAWSTPTVVHISDDPSVPADVRTRYPARIDAPVPAGYRKVEIRSDREMARFEREHHVIHHQRHYDSNGHGADNEYRGNREGWSH